MPPCGRVQVQMDTCCFCMEDVMWVYWEGSFPDLCVLSDIVGSLAVITGCGSVVPCFLCIGFILSLMCHMLQFPV